MKKLLALLCLIPCVLWGADSTIGNLTPITTVPDTYRMPWENPGVADNYITFQNLTNQILTGFVPTLPSGVLTNNWNGGTINITNDISQTGTNRVTKLRLGGASETDDALNITGSARISSVTRLVGDTYAGNIYGNGGSGAVIKSGSATTWKFQNNGGSLGADLYCGSLTPTNGVVQMVKGSFSTNFTCTTNLQFYLCNGTNQIVTLPNAANVPNVIYRFSTTNGYSKLIITNATGAQTVRDGTSLSYTNIGVAEVGFVSDGANWWLASRGKLVQPVAQFSCTTNIPMTLANTAYPVTFNSVDFDFSQGIVLANGTNGSASKMWITNSGIYEFDPSIVVNFGGNNTVTIWFRKDGANVANSATAIKGAAGGSIRCVTIPFVVTVTAPTAYEIWTLSTSTGDSLSFQAAGGVAPDDFPLSPSVICPVKRISDTWP